MPKEYGYAGKIMRVDLSSGYVTTIPTMDYADKFVGGQGIATRIYWDEVPPEVRAFDPENRLIFVNGPAAGVRGLGSSMWKVCAKSPVTVPEHFCQSNLGGRWGVQLKFAGWDGIVVQGKSRKPVYLFIQDDVAEIRDASALWGKGAIDVREALKQELGDAVNVVACGQAGENGVIYANVLADGDSSGSGGMGAVMGSKRLKAIAVRGSGKTTVAQPDKLQQIVTYVRETTRAGALGSRVVQNSKYLGLPYPGAPGLKMKKDTCYGCAGYGCARAIYEAADGTAGKFMCAGASLYSDLASQYYGRREWDTTFFASRLCDNYGLNAFGVSAAISWLSRCHKAGILTDESTGIPLSRIGSREFIETLVRKISLREGFGDILAQGIHRAAEIVGKSSKEILADDYVPNSQEPPKAIEPRLYAPVALLFAMEPRTCRYQSREIYLPVSGWLSWVNHQEGAYLSSAVWRLIGKRFLGSELAADFSILEGKALATKLVQDRESALQSLIMCGWIWPMMVVANSEDHVGDPDLLGKVFSAVTGKEMNGEEFQKAGEALYNLNRAIWVREGHKGRKSDVLSEFYHTVPMRSSHINRECLLPGKDGEVISKKGAVVDRKEFEQMKDEYYSLRGWDVATGLQKAVNLRGLGLDDVATELEQRGLAV